MYAQMKPFNLSMKQFVVRELKIAKTDLRPSKKKDGRQPGHKDWQGWCRGKLRLQLWRIGHCGLLWAQQHSYGGQYELRFSGYAWCFEGRLEELCWSHGLDADEVMKSFKDRVMIVEFGAVRLQVTETVLVVKLNMRNTTFQSAL